MNSAIYRYVPYANEDETLMNYMIDDLERMYTLKKIAKGTGIKEKRFKKGLVFNKKEFVKVLAFYLKERNH